MSYNGIIRKIIHNTELTWQKKEEKGLLLKWRVFNKK